MSATPAYPLPRPATNEDPRFSLGLALDVAEVLTRHGYPPLTAGADLVRLQQALFSLIHQPLDKASPIGNQIRASALHHVKMVGVTGTSDIDSARARSLGAAAADYDRYRPRYPDQLIDDVVAMLPSRRVIEVGAGTGIATAAFAARGMAMTCVEPDPEMAAVLSAKLADNADLHVDVATFEDWSAARPAGGPAFDGLISAQAWHWTDPKTRWADAGAAVRSGGVIALFWNEDGFADPRVEAAYTAAYDRRGIEIRSVQREAAVSSEPDKTGEQKRPDGWPEAHAEAGRYFTYLRTHRYEWTRRMSVADYVARTNTTSAHLILPSEAREDLTAELIATLAGYGDEIELAMTTHLATAVRR